MKKTLAILLAFSCVLALGVIAFAEDISDALSSEPEESMVESIAEADAETEAEIVTDSPASEDAPAEDVPAEDAPAEDAPAEDAPAEDVPAEDAPAEDVPAEDAPAEDVPAEDVPAEDVPAEDVPAEDAPANEPFIINADDGWNAEETAMMSAVLGHRAVGCYRSGYYDSYGWHDDVNYELPAEIVEKYGTSDSRELPIILVYVSDGELDYVETLELYCGINDLGAGTTHVERTEVVSVEIPAGGIAFCPLPWDCIGYGIIGGTYGDKTIEILDSSEPQASIHDPRRYE